MITVLDRLNIKYHKYTEKLYDLLFRLTDKVRIYFINKTTERRVSSIELTKKLLKKIEHYTYDECFKSRVLVQEYVNKNEAKLDQTEDKANKIINLIEKELN